ncbi:hypothetical protein E2C01_065432 [Portunus trituberculatus]|uniref:Uncharacterized protein n=1 Tax=Portunus trituberculatus TaxID=210409 RepID=A0A5B7HIT9_PORTR|nr:hypothetical protein [Portunus trituberculatus]
MQSGRWSKVRVPRGSVSTITLRFLTLRR